MTEQDGPPVQGAAYFPAVEKRYGRPVEHWLDLVRPRRADRPEARYSDLVGWLKTEHGLGHGHATALVAATRPT